MGVGVWYGVCVEWLGWVVWWCGVGVEWWGGGWGVWGCGWGWGGGVCVGCVGVGLCWGAVCVCVSCSASACLYTQERLSLPAIP